MFYEEVKIENLRDGIVLQVGNSLLPGIISNFHDPETDFYAPRKIVLEVTFQADKKLDNIILVEVKGTPKLAPKVVDGGIVRSGTEDGELGLFQETGEQLPMFPDNVRNIRIEGDYSE